MRLMQLIYTSRPFGFDDATLTGILVTARHNNPRLDITGALICRADIYLQLLEGPRPAVTQLFGRIARDDRHLDVTLVSARDAPGRLFGGWAMRDDPARSWLWSQADIAAGAAQEARSEAFGAVFERLAAAPADTTDTARCPARTP